jgi:hypothetical protein
MLVASKNPLPPLSGVTPARCRHLRMPTCKRSSRALRGKKFSRFDRCSYAKRMSCFKLVSAGKHELNERQKSSRRTVLLALCYFVVPCVGFRPIFLKLTGNAKRSYHKFRSFSGSTKLKTLGSPLCHFSVSFRSVVSLGVCLP